MPSEATRDDPVAMTQTPQIGTETGRMEIVVTAEILDDYLAALDMDLPLFQPDAQRRRLVPGDLVPKLGMEPLIQDYCQSVIGPNIRAKQAFRFVAPIHVGERILGVGRLVDIYEKRGRQFVTFEAIYTDVVTGEVRVVDTRTQLVTGQGFQLGKPA